MIMFRSFFGRRKPQNFSPVKHIDAYQLAEMMQNNDDLLLVDVRTPGEYEYDGRIVGSRLVPLALFAARLDELPQDKTIVCICRSGNRSHTACEHLAANGFSDIYNLDGGMLGWRRAGLPFQ
jgi:rhodanese-related sulfurtransferase